MGVFWTFGPVFAVRGLQRREMYLPKNKKNAPWETYSSNSKKNLGTFRGVDMEVDCLKDSLNRVFDPSETDSEGKKSTFRPPTRSKSRFFVFCRKTFLDGGTCPPRPEKAPNGLFSPPGGHYSTQRHGQRGGCAGRKSTF